MWSKLIFLSEVFFKKKKKKHFETAKVFRNKVLLTWTYEINKPVIVDKHDSRFNSLWSSAVSSKHLQLVIFLIKFFAGISRHKGFHIASLRWLHSY